jgi:hypothetical protein
LVEVWFWSRSWSRSWSGRVSGPAVGREAQLLSVQVRGLFRFRSDRGRDAVQVWLRLRCRSGLIEAEMQFRSG